ncbi:DUF6153 family protein [Streptomyces somaliensis DSM 40738]|uniref:Uncharacterized protein n=1 Tax=Streptomyces somaliensis (strain ATCC 33201 / DSM 40738 / JCM 12659 / KCTC 9044 / NCTC 11332 / NRRL B-12077 / IP 733) TaxID=1134445 RepID=A0AA44IDY8_STRE0|nr:DUF6153 family protein [Streptomyces somaliensis]MCQ0025426.1 DUF6153 family protein [Streptomyces somaliensis DSM 40738]NKY15220.1 hypothetical protein [Streptomyces somaliensis DSM 40738]
MISGTGPGRRPTGRLFALLVAAVLAGVLGMHALGPDGARVTPAPGHGAVTAEAPVDPRTDGGCAHPDGVPGHPDHADGTCAAAGTGSAYAPPALIRDLTEESRASAPAASAAAPTESGRAPPDLSELQLLRV